MSLLALLTNHPFGGKLEMKMEHKKTKFDGKKAMIIGDHPHEGATSICLGADKTNCGWGILFKNTNSEEEFYVFDGKNIKWID